MVQAKIAYATATKVFKISIKPFNEGALKQGGSDARIMGSGNDDITGVANGPNGGRVAMHEDKAFFVDTKNFLRESNEPFKAALAYKASGYAWLDTLDDNLYYYHHYLAKKGLTNKISITDAAGLVVKPGTKSSYVTRIVRDPVGRKGRRTLVELKSPLQICP